MFSLSYLPTTPLNTQHPYWNSFTSTKTLDNYFQHPSISFDPRAQCPFMNKNAQLDTSTQVSSSGYVPPHARLANANNANAQSLVHSGREPRQNQQPREPRQDRPPRDNQQPREPRQDNRPPHDNQQPREPREPRQDNRPPRDNQQPRRNNNYNNNRGDDAVASPTTPDVAAAAPQTDSRPPRQPRTYDRPRDDRPRQDNRPPRDNNTTNQRGGFNKSRFNNNPETAETPVDGQPEGGVDSTPADATSPTAPESAPPTPTAHNQSNYTPPNKFLSQEARQAQANSGATTQETGPTSPSTSHFSNRGGYNSRRNEPRRHQTGGPNDPEYEKTLFGEARTGIDFTSYDDVPASASGKNVPKQIKSFTEIAFGKHVEENLKLCGYERPTPIQKFSLPIGMANRDMIACAQTGSGKTAAFLLPTIYRLLNSDILPPPSTQRDEGRLIPGQRSFHRLVQAPQALILGPTRELVTQIFKEAQKFTYRTSVQPMVVYGGVPIIDQMAELAKGCHLLVATPGRLSDLCERGRISLQNIQMLIFDEADCMLDMGFLPQIEDLMNKFDMPHSNRQTLMFSATFPPEIQRLASAYLTEYLYITIGRVGSSTSLVTQRLIQAPTHEEAKREQLLGLLDDCDGLTLIFVETRRSADLLETFLVSNEINAASIHGDRTQVEREQALSYFKSGHCPVLVATDVASRGLSIPNVEYVINYDMPNAIDDYVHRIGRTGRCGARGIATSFIGEKNKAMASDLLENMREAKQVIPVFLQTLVDSSSSRGYGGGFKSGGGYKSGGGNGGKSTRAGHADVRTSQASSGPTGNYGSSSTSSISTSATPATAKQQQQQQATFSVNSTKPQTSASYDGSSALNSIQASDDAW